MKRSKAERRAVGTLALVQSKAVADLRRTFRKRAGDEDDPASPARIAPALTAVLYARRQAARSAARRRLAAELRDLGVEVHGPDWVVLDRSAADLRRAQMVADSLASQWRQVAGKLEEETGTPSALMRARLERAAKTEIATAYSEEHREALRDLVRNDRTYRDGELAAEIESKLRRRWSALADACERCFPLDGEEVGVDESFPGGEVPGGVHPHCLCVEYLVAI